MNRLLKHSIAFLTMISMGISHMMPAQAALVTPVAGGQGNTPNAAKTAAVKQKLVQSYNYMINTPDEKWESDIDTAVEYLNQRGESEKVRALLSLKDKSVKDAALKGIKEKIDDTSSNGIASLLLIPVFTAEDLNPAIAFIIVILSIPLLIVTLSGETAESY